MRTLDPVHKDASFTLEAMKGILQTAGSAAKAYGMAGATAAGPNENTGTRSIITSAVNAGLPEFLLRLLDGRALDATKDPASAKVHVVDMLKALSGDSVHGERVNGILAQNPVWEQYRHQKHDLFVSKNQRTDYFLTNSTEVLAIKNEADSGAAGERPPPKEAQHRQAQAPPEPPSLFD